MSLSRCRPCASALDTRSHARRDAPARRGHPLAALRTLASAPVLGAIVLGAGLAGALLVSPLVGLILLAMFAALSASGRRRARAVALVPVRVDHRQRAIDHDGSLR